MDKSELIKDLERIWDVENMLKEFGEPLPEFCKTYLEGIKETEAYILSREAAIREKHELRMKQTLRLIEKIRQYYVNNGIVQAPHFYSDELGELKGQS